MVVQILQNAALISFVAFGVYWVWQRTEVPENRLGQIVLGVNFGLVAFLVTATPIVTDDGATIDARAGPVILSGIVAGPIAALIAAAFGAIARAFVGGTFAFSGSLVYFLYAAAATAIWAYGRRSAEPNRVNAWRVGAGGVASIVAASLMFLVIQPRETAALWLVNDLPLIGIANLFSVALAGSICAIAIAAAERKNELKSALETLKLAKSAGGIGIWTYDPKTDRADWDETNRDLHGLEDFEGGGNYADWQAIVHPADLSRVKNEFKDALAGTADFDTTYRVQLPDGSIRHLRGNAVVIRDGASMPVRVVGANVDLTPLVEMDSALVEARDIASQAQKLEAIGELTGGVAHDFNNILSVVLGNIELARDRTEDADLLECLDQAEAATARGSDLTRNMLAFARKAELNPTVLDVNTVVLDAKSWMLRTLPESIEIDLALGPDTWPVYADKSGLETCLLNLLLNAKDSMSGAGKVTIETSNLEVRPEDEIAKQDEIPTGRYTMLAISDNGDGIAPEVLDQVFDPFFTTKEVGKGSGLGLSMVLGFMRQSGGAVRVYSEPNIGTSVKLYIPASSANLIQDEAASKVALPSQSNARILLVEDDEKVRRVLVQSLRDTGYKVVETATGDEALTLFINDSSFDLVITDIVMPGKLQGPALAKEMRKRKPSQKVLFMTGYASGGDAAGNEPVNDLRLMKPVRRVELIQAIEEVLARKS